MNRYPRRNWLQRASAGMGWLAFRGLQGLHAAETGETKMPHYPARTRQVIFLYMDGGPSQVDTFDPKPRLAREHGKPFPIRPDATQFDAIGKTLKSHWEFDSHGRSGIPVSRLLPRIASCVDELCVVRSMSTPFPEHAQANYFLHTGSGLQGRPSMGAWASYGLGNESDNLPGFVALNGGMVPIGGLANWSNGFLPAIHEATQFNLAGGDVLENLKSNLKVSQTSRLLQFVNQQDRAFAAQLGEDAGPIESAIHNQELAARMQTSVPDAADLSGESQATHRLYGTDSKDALQARYARQCLMARRLVERGVRFVEVGAVSGIRNVAPWDSHSNLKRDHERNAFIVDQPIAALLKDLKGRGLLDETLVLWSGEFGRTPFAQGGDGRDHNPQGFSVWMAGGGIRGGHIHGATDELGYRAVEDVVTMHDLHATILHLMGMDHERLTFLHGGRNHRLTDVHGEVVSGLLG